ncbi:MAG TPA: CoA pyrophosphatase [Myxococcaceae bacterium]
MRSLERLLHPIEGWGDFRPGARPAAVVFILFEAPEPAPGGPPTSRWIVPFVRRRGDLRDHPGQVALPGGGIKAGESAWDGAQREVAEELGVPVGRLVPLGAGDPIYAAVSNFSVVPFVAHLPGPVPDLVHDPLELEGVLAIPLDRLLDDAAWLVSDDAWRFRYLAHEESVVWGLTERIFAGLAPKLREALAEGRPARDTGV